MRPSFANQESPLIVNVIRERTKSAVLAAMKNGHYDGAMGYDLHLSCLDKEYQTLDQLKSMISATSKPILALNYNQKYNMEMIGMSEEERVELLLLAIEAGASAADIQGYTFDTEASRVFEEQYATDDMLFRSVKPREIALKPEIVKKQIELIEKIHSMGAEVLMSCHTGVVMNSEQVVSLAKELEKRGPDIIKIVTPCENDDQLVEAFRTIVELKRSLKTRFQYHCQGSHGRPTRIFGPMLGSYLIFCIDRYTESSNPEQLHLKTITEMYRKLDWK